MKHKSVLKLTYAALCLALAMVLPFLTAQLPPVAKATSPMHIPIYLCGFLCGWPWGLAVGIIAPLMRSALFGMPVFFPSACAMAFELGTYGLLSGILYSRFPKKTPYIYTALLLSMVSGRIVWGVMRYIFADIQGTAFTFAAFVAGAVTDAVPGIILHILLIPVLVMALKKAGLILNQ